MSGKKGEQHHAYLLRCWRVGRATAGEKPHWRFYIEEVLQKRPRQGFDDLDALVAFLRTEFVDGDQAPDRDPSGVSSEGKGNKRFRQRDT